MDLEALIQALLDATDDEARNALLAELPEGVTLAEVEAELVRKLDELLDAESNDLPAMSGLAEVLTGVRGAIAADEAADAERAAQRDELRRQVHGEDASDEPADPETPAEEPAQPAEPETPAEPVEAVTAATRRPSAAGTRRNAPRPRPEPRRSPVVITAAADVPNLPLNAQLDVTQIAQGFHDRARGLSDNGHRAPVASIQMESLIPTTDWVDPGATEANADVLRRVCGDDSPQARWNQPSQPALVAAGGWCTPSEPLYDIFRLDDTQGLFTLPTVGVRRGGMNIPSPLLFDATSLAGALWTWTEGTDATTVLAVTNKALTSNVATLTTATTHNLTVGMTVKVAIGDPVFDGTYVVSAVPSGTTFSYARTNANVTSAAATGTATKQKGCLRIPCPTWTDYRLEVEGLCVSHGNLMDVAYPELTREFVAMVLSAHELRVSTAMLAKVQASITAPAAVTMTTGPSSAASELLSAVELQIMDFRSQYTMSDGRSLELAFPDWARGVIRNDMAMRAGIGRMDVSDAEINGWFAIRGARPQFVKNYQPLYATTPKTAWPTTVKFLVWPTGGYVKGTGPRIDLGVTRDSTLNATNDFTAAWSEQSYTVGQRGPDAREVTVTILADGVTAVGP